MEGGERVETPNRGTSRERLDESRASVAFRPPSGFSRFYLILGLGKVAIGTWDGIAVLVGVDYGPDLMPLSGPNQPRV